MAKPDAPCVMKVAVVYAPGPRLAREWVVELPSGSTVQQAIEIGDVQQICPELADMAELLATGALTLGVWGQACKPDRVLNDLDRVEIYRPLRVDPKVARRERFRGQGVKRAGLFANKREGSKAGY